MAVLASASCLNKGNTMTCPNPNPPSDEDMALHELRTYLHLYGRDLDLLFCKLPATRPKSSWTELYSAHGVHLDPQKIVAHLANVIAGLENLPLHLRVDDGAYQAPYRNVAFRAEAQWHRDALAKITQRLSAAAIANPG